jgi:hypothetical protein
VCVVLFRWAFVLGSTGELTRLVLCFEIDGAESGGEPMPNELRRTQPIAPQWAMILLLAVWACFF